MRFINFASFLLLFSTSVHGVQSNIADSHISTPTLHGFSHPKLSPHTLVKLSVYATLILRLQL